MPEHFRVRHEDGLSRHLKTGGSNLIGRGPRELAGLHRDGWQFPLELTLGELREEGEVLFTGILRDITDGKEAEDKVRQAEERYRTLVERMPAVTYIQEIGSPDSAMYMSPQIEALTGYTPEDCQNPDLRWRMVHPADRERLRQSGEEQMGEPGEVFTHEYRLLRRDGRTVWVRNESSLVEEAPGGPRYWHGFMVDITERKRAEAGLRAYAAKLQRSNRELQDFAHVASHDLQEPLRKVSSFGERLRTKYGDALGDQGLDYLARMEGATVRMQGLIEDLLSLSRVTTQANPFEPVDLAVVVPEVLSDLEARLEETGGTVKVGALPTVEADRAQMRQLLQNLISNALKFHKEGEPPGREGLRGARGAGRATAAVCGAGWSWRTTA
jgi:two-component system sensor kinase FixL